MIELYVLHKRKYNKCLLSSPKYRLYEQDRYWKYGTVVGKYFLLLMDKVASIRGISDDGSDQYINKRELITSAEDVIIGVCALHYTIPHALLPSFQS